MSHKISWLSQADGRKGQNLNQLKWNCASLHKLKRFTQLLRSAGRQVLSPVAVSLLQFGDPWALQGLAPAYFLMSGDFSQRLQTQSNLLSEVFPDKCCAKVYVYFQTVAYFYF